MNIYKPKDFSKIINKSVRTLQRWDRENYYHHVSKDIADQEAVKAIVGDLLVKQMISKNKKLIGIEIFGTVPLLCFSQFN